MTMRSYAVRTADEAARNRHAINAESLEGAALAYAEDCHLDGEEVRVLVTDCETGREHCLVLDLSSGEARDC